MVLWFVYFNYCFFVLKTINNYLSIYFLLIVLRSCVVLSIYVRHIVSAVVVLNGFINKVELS